MSDVAVSTARQLVVSSPGMRADGTGRVTVERAGRPEEVMAPGAGTVVAA